jgi:UDP-N-acetylglucosamine 4-epimerase
MNSKHYHKHNLSNYSFLITGGAGFIGSNLVAYLLEFGAGKVIVLDNLSNGYYSNIEPFLKLPNFEFINGDIRNLETCRSAVKNVDYISHQAALGSVPRSISDPILSNEVNISGFLNMMQAAKESTQLKRFVYAASSSTYGDSADLPKVEGREGKPLSPYAVTKAVNEMYANVFSKVYGFHTIGLRYFNVFGPRQNPNNPYAAVIPLFCKAFIEGKSPVIFGDGETSRDFTFVENAVQANIKAFELDLLNHHEVFNVACGQQTTLNEMIAILNKISNKQLVPNYMPERTGDVKHSRASIDKAREILGFEPRILFQEGLENVFNWYGLNLDALK